MNSSQQLFKTVAEAASDQARLQLQAASQAFLSTTNNHSIVADRADQQRQMALLSLFSSLSSLASNSNSNTTTTTSNTNTNQQQQLFHQQNQKEEHITNSLSNAGQQRINYCTICNKELCNKYFMKTHMLKMHGISLEMDTSQNGSDDDNQNQSQSQNQNQDDPNEEDNDQSQPEDCSLASQKQQTNSGSSWKTRKESQSSQSSATSNTIIINNNSSNSKSSNNKQATSVMNGFAGNSMGGVICDICNKELCSKYFLKVHKQNTHGISTDSYHDASPFAAIYPFAAAASLPGLALPVGLMAGAQPQPFGQAAVGSGASSSSRFECAADSRLPSRPAADEKPRSSPSKKARLGSNVIESKPCEPAAGQLESLYRLMLAQQTRQHTVQPLAEDPVAAAMAAMNPLNALMCFGGAQQAAGAFMSPVATLSPAMIVDQILRNQHLFSQHQHRQQQPQPQLQQNINNQASSNSKATDRNNNGESPNKQKANANKRYFSHYTEACLMCDRRFKSIKWLKTHMMNDHKHEIGAYLQSMMQYIYQTNSKSQQMAALEQQQQAAAALFQQQQQYSTQHLQSGQLMGVFSQQRPFNLAPQAFVADHNSQQQQQYHNHSADLLFDARCSKSSRSSLSPVDSLLSHHHQQQQLLNIKREPTTSSDSPPIGAHHPPHHQNHVHSSQPIEAADEAHDLSAGYPAAPAASLSDCELLHFELADRSGPTFPSPSPDSHSSGPILGLDSRPQQTGIERKSTDFSSPTTTNSGPAVEGEQSLK